MSAVPQTIRLLSDSAYASIDREIAKFPADQKQSAVMAALAIAVVLSGFLAFYSARLVWQSVQFNDISVGIDATPMWIPQTMMAVGTFIFFIAFVDELVLEILGKRSSAPSEELHHE